MKSMPVSISLSHCYPLLENEGYLGRVRKWFSGDVAVPAQDAIQLEVFGRIVNANSLATVGAGLPVVAKIPADCISSLGPESSGGIVHSHRLVSKSRDRLRGS